LVYTEEQKKQGKAHTRETLLLGGAHAGCQSNDMHTHYLPESSFRRTPRHPKSSWVVLQRVGTKTGCRVAGFVGSWEGVEWWLSCSGTTVVVVDRKQAFEMTLSGWGGG